MNRCIVVTVANSSYTSQTRKSTQVVFVFTQLTIVLYALKIAHYAHTQGNLNG